MSETPGTPGTSGAFGARGGRGRVHTRQEVVRAAVALADAEGLDAVTIRAVARRLGTGVMSLYSYVPDKQTLVYDMVEEVSGELNLPARAGPTRPACAGPLRRACLRRACLRRACLRRACRRRAATGGPACTCWRGRRGRCCAAIRG